MQQPEPQDTCMKAGSHLAAHTGTREAFQIAGAGMTAHAHEIHETWPLNNFEIGKANQCIILAELRIGVQVLVELKPPADHNGICLRAMLVYGKQKTEQPCNIQEARW